MAVILEVIWSYESNVKKNCEIQENYMIVIKG